MEKWEKEYIRKNLVRLIETTHCNPLVISILRAKNILADIDAAILESLSDMRFEQSKKMYDILITRVNAFSVLIKALEDTRQSGAAAILKDTKSVFRNFGRISYDKNHVLGKGCLGTKVFKGTFGGRDVAVKVLNTNLVDGKTAKREVEMLKKLDAHENIIRYFTAEEDENSILIALELCFISLEDNVKMKLVEIPNITLLRKCTAGLAHLHKPNVIHRDLKPANILPTHDGQVKLSDFGLSTEIPKGATSVSIGSNVVGTVDWRPPEILKVLYRENSEEKSKLNKASDIFPLGCIFFFVLSNGQHPFGEVMLRQYNIVNDKPVLIHILKDDPMKTLITKMIANSPKNRPTSEEILNDDCLQSEGVTTPTSSRPCYRVELPDEAESLHMERSERQKSEIPRPTTSVERSLMRIFQIAGGQTPGTSNDRDNDSDCDSVTDILEPLAGNALKLLTKAMDNLSDSE